MASRRVFFAISWLLAGSLGGAVGCFPPDEGRPPPLDHIYFPVGIAVSPGKSWMYVANSDFDLQYNAGTVQVYDLPTLRSKVPRYCSTDADCASHGQVCDTALGKDPDNQLATAPTHRCVDPAHPDPCASVGTTRQTPGDQVLSPGLCGSVDAGPFLYKGTQQGAVAIGAFVTDVIYATNPLKNGRGARLFLPVRGDATMHWIDVDDDTPVPPTEPSRRTGKVLDCGQPTGGSQACNQDHRRGSFSYQENTRQVVLPSEPYALALQARPYAGAPVDTAHAYVQDNHTGAAQVDGGITSYSEALVTTHQTSGEIGLFVNNWTTGGGEEDGPVLQFVAGGLPLGALSVAAVPLPAFWVEFPDAVTYVPSFLTTFRNAPQVSLVRYFTEPGADPQRPFLDVSRSVAITTNSVGVDSRGIAVDNSARAACESPVNVEGDPSVGKCTPQALEEKRQMMGAPVAQSRFECLLAECETIPVDVYVANRTPASLIIGKSPPSVPRTLTDDLPRFYDSVPISSGPSRVVVGHVVDLHGKLVRRVFVICFDSRRIFVFDPDARRLETEIITGRGPHAFAVDIGSNFADLKDEVNGYAYAYVGLFSDSYIAVIDLDQRHTETYGKVVLNVGHRTPPRASK